MVGSAPVDDQLLTSFRELGVEIHNAYGLTEAPLVTLNRLGRNRIGTVGEPLPETHIRIAGDGESRSARAGCRPGISVISPTTAGWSWTVARRTC
jgi:long-chain acyl-CoA synthetase